MANRNVSPSRLALVTVALLTLLAIGLVVSWQVAMIVLLAVGLLWLGYWLAGEKLAYDRARLRLQWQVLEAEQRAMEQTRRIRGVFLEARRAMQEEALRTMQAEHRFRTVDQDRREER